MAWHMALALDVQINVRAYGAWRVWVQMGHTAWHMAPALDA
jgi:hypothetical protein